MGSFAMRLLEPSRESGTRMSSSTDVSRRARYWSLGAVGLGIVVVLIAAFASRRIILEEWQLSRLQSTDQQTRKNAAQALGEYGSVRSIPLLMRATRTDSFGFDLGGWAWLFAKMLNRREVLAVQMSAISPDVIHEPGLSTLHKSLKRQLVAVDADLAGNATPVDSTLMNSPYWQSLTKITQREKKAAVPYLLHELDGDDWRIRWLAVRLLGSLGPDAEDAVPVLKTKTRGSTTAPGGCP